MAYQKHNFKDGDILKAEHLNCIEDCIAEEPNWNAAEGEPGHVLNRTHWVEPNGVLMEESEADEMTDPTFGKVWRIHTAPNLEAGKTYTVVYNGTPFSCACQFDPSGTSDDPNALCMGNFSIAGYPDTGEPFVMLITPIYNTMTLIDLTGSATSVKVEILGEVTHKLSSQFIPDDVPHVEKVGFEPLLPECQPASLDGGFVIENAPALEVGLTYRVRWNGADYDCIGIDVSEYYNAEAVALGDVHTVTNGEYGTESTGEPFVIAYASEEGAALCFPLDGTSVLTLSIDKVKEKIHKIDPRCLPEEKDNTIFWVKGNLRMGILDTTLNEIGDAFKQGKRVYYMSYDGEEVVQCFQYSEGEYAIFAYYDSISMQYKKLLPDGTMK